MAMTMNNNLFLTLVILINDVKHDHTDHTDDNNKVNTSTNMLIYCIMRYYTACDVCCMTTRCAVLCSDSKMLFNVSLSFNLLTPLPNVAVIGIHHRLQRSTTKFLVTKNGQKDHF